MVNEKATICFPYHKMQDILEWKNITLDGWQTDIGWCCKAEDLSKDALDYIRFIENAVNCNIKYVSVGAYREEYVAL